MNIICSSTHVSGSTRMTDVQTRKRSSSQPWPRQIRNWVAAGDSSSAEHLALPTPPHASSIAAKGLPTSRHPAMGFGACSVFACASHCCALSPLAMQTERCNTQFSLCSGFSCHRYEACAPAPPRATSRPRPPSQTNAPRHSQSGAAWPAQ